MSAKNRLQELCQKNHLSLPRYKTGRVGGSDHNPIWKSTVTLYNNHQFTGKSFSHKLAAELSAAESALEYFSKIPMNLYNHNSCLNYDYTNSPSIQDNSKTIQPTYTKTRDEREINYVNPVIFEISPIDEKKLTPMKYQSMNNVAMLVDLENMPKFLDNIKDRLNEFTIYVFVGEHNALIERKLPKDVIKVVSPSTRSDGTDTCMQVYTGMLLSLDKHDEYIIVTRDHFGSALVEMITSSNLGWKPRSARVVTLSAQL